MDRKQDVPEDPDADGPASGSVEHPIRPGDVQPGDRAELGSNLGGPVDVAPGAGRGTSSPSPSSRTGPEKRQD